MPDTYKNFGDLAAHETEGTDFSIRASDRDAATAVIAPHGGSIEPGTSELAEAIAGANFSFYAFEGTKPAGNAVLHVTSTRFDEPLGRGLVARSQNALALHGEESDEPIVFLGGLDTALAGLIKASLEESGFRVETHANRELQGISRENICNRTATGRGVQLELSKGLREKFFSSLSRTGRQTRTVGFDRFVAAVRRGIDGRV